MVQICDGVSNAGKNGNPRQLSICSDVCSAVEDQPGRQVIRGGVQERHRCRVGRVPPAETCNLSGISPFSSHGAVIGERGEIGVVKAARPGPSHKLHAFVDVKMMLAEVLTHEDLCQVRRRSNAELGPCRGESGHIENRQRRASIFLRK